MSKHTPLTPEQVDAIVEDAGFYMETGIEPTSAIKQAAADHGVPEGKQMKAAVEACREVFGF